jgi:hypothetical protein
MAGVPRPQGFVAGGNQRQAAASEDRCRRLLQLGTGKNTGCPVCKVPRRRPATPPTVSRSRTRTKTVSPGCSIWYPERSASSHRRCSSRVG